MNAKVCILTTVHPPFDPRIFHRQARSLAKAGYDVRLIAQHGGDETVDGVQIRALRRPRNRVARIVGLTWRALRMAKRERAGVYHFHDPELILVGLILRLTMRSRVIYDVHEDYPNHMLTKEWIPALLRRPTRWLMLSVEWLAARSLDAIVTPTDSITDRFARMGARRAVTVMNLPSAEFLEVPPAEELPQPADVLHVGSLSAARLEFLLDVACAVEKTRPGTSWRIVGMNNALLAEAQTLVAQKNLSDVVEVVGKVSHETIGRHLRVCRLGVNHHPCEARFAVAVPVKVLEYMAAGMPVVSSEMALLRGLTADKGILYVEPGDRDVFARAVSTLLHDSALAARLGEEARQLARDRLNWKCEEPRFLGFYKELLS